MNTKPVSYLQTDPRWGSLDYSAKGEKTTSSGHFVLVWKIQGNVIYINDPASTRAVRTQGDYALFKSQVKYYFVVERPATQPEPTEPKKEEEEEMDVEKFLKQLTDAQAYALLEKAMRHAASLPEPEWSQTEGAWKKATEKGLVNGLAPEGYVKRDELAAVLGRGGVL